MQISKVNNQIYLNSKYANQKTESKSKLSFTADLGYVMPDVANLIRKNIALHIGGRFAVETFEESAKESMQSINIPKEIINKMRRSEYPPRGIQIQKNIGTTEASKDLLKIFQPKIPNFREVIPGFVYAGGPIPDEETAKMLANHDFKHKIHLMYISPTNVNDKFKNIIKNALQNKEKIYMYCNWGTHMSDSFILLSNIIFKKVLSKDLLEKIDKSQYKLIVRLIEQMDDSFDTKKMQKIEEYIENPELLEKDLDLNKDI